MSRYGITDNDDINAVIIGINELDTKKRVLELQRRAQIEELVLHAEFSEKDADAALALLASVKPEHRLDLEETSERIALCKKFISVFGTNGLYKRDFGASLKKSQEYRVGMLENRYSTAALNAFESGLPLCSVLYQSFEEVCENIVNSTCDFGIIPTESSDNGKLLRFYSLINRYDLKINAVSDIEYSDSSATTRYALVSKGIEYPESSLGTPDYFEFSINLHDPQALNFIIYAASLCSMRLHRIDSLPISYKDREFLFCPIFEVKDADIDTFILYMYLDFPQYTPLGIFPRI